MKKLILILLIGISVNAQTELDTTFVFNGSILMDSTWIDNSLSIQFDYGTQPLFKIKTKEELDADFLEYQKEWTLNLLGEYFKKEDEPTFEGFYKWLQSNNL